VFLFFRLAYESSQGRFTPQKFFFGYLIVPAFILLAQVIVMNADGYKTVPQLEEKVEKAQDAARDVCQFFCELFFSPSLTVGRCTTQTTI